MSRDTPTPPLPPPNSPDTDACGICLSNQMELPIRLPCNHVFCFLCIKSWIDNTTNCPFCREEVDPDECHKLPLMKELMSDYKPSNWVWQYSGRMVGYWDYSPQMNQHLESKYQEFCSATNGSSSSGTTNSDPGLVEISIGATNYMVDFVKMVQYPVSSPGKSRGIRRVPTNVTQGRKGIAGLSRVTL